MSWDISVFAASDPPPPVASMPADWRAQVLGTRQQVRDQISQSVPGTDWTDPCWGNFAGDGFSFEFNIGSEEPNTGFMIHVRGGGDAVGLLLGLAKRSGWFLLDCSSGEWLHHCQDAGAGWQRFQAYRDSVFAKAKQDPSESPTPGKPKKAP